jgi:hypothetical protein
MDEHRIFEGDAMKVGDLVMLNNKHLAIVISRDMPTRTMIKWLEDGVVEDANNYILGLEVISESR